MCGASGAPVRLIGHHCQFKSPGPEKYATDTSLFVVVELMGALRRTILVIEIIIRSSEPSDRDDICQNKPIFLLTRSYA